MSTPYKKSLERKETTSKWRKPTGPRDKNTICPSILQTKLAETQHLSPTNLYYTNPCQVFLSHTYNHPITSAAPLSHRDIAETTKIKLYQYFSNGDSPAAAIHKLRHHLKDKRKHGYEVALSDRCYNPRKRDVYRLHKKWLQNNIRPESRDGMLKELENWGVKQWEQRQRWKGSSAKIWGWNGQRQDQWYTLGPCHLYTNNCKGTFHGAVICRDSVLRFDGGFRSVQELPLLVKYKHSSWRSASWLRCNFSESEFTVTAALKNRRKCYLQMLSIDEVILELK